MHRYALLLSLFTAPLAFAEANCKAYETGTTSVIAEEDASSMMDCSKRMQNAVKAARCSSVPGGSTFKYEMWHAKLASKRTPQQVYCKK